jgi:peptidyl-prolyl cis-trans isomerase C
MKKYCVIPFLLLFTVAATAQAQGIKVNGATIPQARIDFLVKNAVGQGQPDSPELRNQIKEELINRELAAQEAAKRGLDKTPEVAMQLDLQRQGVLINAYVQDYLKNHPVTEDTMKKEYEQAKATIGNREYKASHILVEKEEEAKEIIAQVRKGGSFEKIASEKSKDQGSKANGGDLGWSAPSRYVPAFAQALQKLKKGQITDSPVQTPYGWHVIKVDDERATKIPPYEEVKPQIQQQLRQQQVTKAIAELRAKAKITE